MGAKRGQTMINELSKNSLVELAGEINKEHNLCLNAMRDSLQHAVNCGRLLMDAKELLPHGSWLPWLIDNCPFSERTAQAYMRVTQHYPELKSAVTADLTLDGALMLLQEPHQAITHEEVEDYENEMRQQQLENLRMRLEQVTTIPEALALEKEAKLLVDRYRAQWEASHEKTVELKIQSRLEIFDNSPIINEPCIDDSRLIPLETYWKNECDQDELLLNVNRSTRNFKSS
jgi:hypothetical protein